MTNETQLTTETLPGPVDTEILRQLDFWIEWLSEAERQNKKPTGVLIIKAGEFSMKLRPEVESLKKVRTNFRGRARRAFKARDIRGRINTLPSPKGPSAYKPVNLPKPKPGELDEYKVIK